MTSATRTPLWCALLLSALASTAPGAAQQVFTASDYDRASRFLAQGVNGMVAGGSVDANWLPDGRFWYRSTAGSNAEFILVDPARKTRAPAFDHTRIAAALSSASSQSYTAQQLPFQVIEFSSK